MSNFIDDVCVVMAGHRRALGRFERQVYTEARMRLLARGNALIEHEAVKLEFEEVKGRLNRIEADETLEENSNNG